MGSTLFEKKKAAIQINDIKTMSPRIILKSETPADFIAVSSKFSPRFPKTINAASKMASGNAIGTIVKEAYQKNSPITSHDTPFPIKSCKCFHINCIKRISITIKKVIKKYVRNDFNI